MRKTILKIFFISVVYVLIINQVPNFLETNGGGFSIQEREKVGVIKVGFSEKVGVSVVRPRFYGRMEEGGEEKTFYLLNLIKLPLKNKGVDFERIHLLYLFFLGIFLKGGGKMKPVVKALLWSLLFGVIYFFVSAGNWENTVLIIFLYNYFEVLRRQEK